MGVQGLWELLTPVGRRISVDTLGNRKLAVDASIWIVQFMKAMRDEKGDMIHNAHLLGFYRRICKLLFLRVKPIFVFDGATPALKRRTVLARRRQREKAQSRIRKTAEKLLINHVKRRTLEEIASENDLNPQSLARSKRGEEGKEHSIPDAGPSISHGQGPATSGNYDREATDALLAATLRAGYDAETGQDATEVLEGSDGGEDDDDEEEQLIIPGVEMGVDPSVLASLPTSMQLDLLLRMKQQLVTDNRKRYQKVASVPSSFSKIQIESYLQGVAFRKEITEVQKAAAAAGGIGGVPTDRVASTTDREFIFTKSFQGEKPRVNEITEQASAPKPVPAQPPNQMSIRPMSELFSAGTRKPDKPEDEDGVISLFSTELNEQTDSNSNSVAPTYVDEKGNVRVHRRRGMGVHMGRDLQWNLYLMKDVEARKSGEHAWAENDPPIIPPGTTKQVLSSQDNYISHGTPLTQAEDNSISHGTPLTQAQDDYISQETPLTQGVEISFVDDGSSALGEDDDGLFRELVMDRADRSRPAEVKSDPGVTYLEAEEDDDDDEEDDDEEEWEDCGIVESTEDGTFEDRDMAEAVRLSLLDQQSALNANEPSNQSVLEDRASSGESVQCEEGTGYVASNEIAENEMIISQAEEAEIQEAITRSLQDFGPPLKTCPQLVIREPSENGSSNAQQDLKVVPGPSPNLAAGEEESEELHMARERTRKGKAVLGEEDEKSTSPCSVMKRPNGMSEQDQVAARTLSEMPLNGVTAQVPPRFVDNSLDRVSPSSIDFRSINIPETTESCMGSSQVGVASSLEAEASVLEGNVGSQKADKADAANSKVELCAQTRETLEIRPSSLQCDGPLGVRDAKKQARSSGESKEVHELGGPLHEFDGKVDDKAPLHPSQAGPKGDGNLEDLIREAEEADTAMDREEVQRREALLIEKTEQERVRLAREEAELQAELDQQEARLALAQERELLDQEAMGLRAEQKKNERNAEAVTGDMFAEVQELLQMFGVPYIIAPMEAEAQCAFMETLELIDGVVTDDSDVFLFGGRNVYKNLFADHKYVEAFSMKDLESEMGMSREKMIRIALLLGSDYTEGISGIGIVNAIEVVNAFPEEGGLQKFKEWLDSPDHELFQKVQGHSRGKGKGGESGLDEGHDKDEAAETGLTALQRNFMANHRAVSKNWNIPESFPSEAVVAAYLEPTVDKSREKFSWGRPDLDALRRFCLDKFSWHKEKADEHLLPVLKQFDSRETQTRLESFYQFDTRFAKIRSRRIQKAVTGMTGKRSAELMDLPPHLITKPPPKKPARKRKLANPADSPQTKNSSEDVSHIQQQSSSQVDPSLATDTKETGRGLKGRQKRGRKQQPEDSQDTDPLAGNVEIEVKLSTGGRRGRGKGRGRGRAASSGRSRGRSRGKGGVAAMEEEEASLSSSSDSDVVMSESLQAGRPPLKRNADDTLQPRRSTRQRPQITTYCVDNSDDEAGGACSDGEEITQEVQTPRIVKDDVDTEVDTEAGAAFSDGEEGIREFDKIMADALRQRRESGGFENPSLVGDGAEANKGMSSEINTFGNVNGNDFEIGGGFCPSEDEGEQGKESSEHFGGGFCLSEDESDPPPAVRDGHAGIDQIHATGGGLDLKEGNDVQLAELRSDVYNPTNTSELGESVKILLTDQGVDGSTEVVGLGLRAMPLMRRKKKRVEQ